jgi:hypothetical protein
MDSQSKNTFLKTILTVMTIGIWMIVLQNAGVVPTKQNVYVKGGYIDADVSGSVRVSNSVEVEVGNTVSVSIDEVLDRDGKKYFYNND